MRVDYYEYINSPEWRRRADAAKARAGYRCRVCNRHADEVVLNAHHRTYERLGNEDPDDITVLCRDCHELYETHDKSPKKFRKQSKPVEVKPYTLPLPERPAVKSTSTLGSSRPATPAAPVPSKVPVAKVAAKPSTTPVVTAQKKQNILGTILGFIIITAGLIAAIPISNRFITSTVETPVPTATFTAVPLPTVATNLPVDEYAKAYTHIVSGGAPFYFGPSTKYSIVATLAEGATVGISAYALCDNSTWYRIGQNRWIPSATVVQPELTLPYVEADCSPDSVEEVPTPTTVPVNQENKIRVDDFLMMKDAVTIDEYHRCIGAGKCTAPSDYRWDRTTHGNYAVTFVTWYQAKDYADYVGGRLPTAAEWESACLAGAYGEYREDKNVWEWTAEIDDSVYIRIYDTADCAFGLSRLPDETARRLGFRVLFPTP